MIKRLFLTTSLVVATILVNTGCSTTSYNIEADNVLNEYKADKHVTEKVYFGISAPEILNIYRASLIEEYGEVLFYPYRDKLIGKYTKAGLLNSLVPEVIEYEWLIETSKVGDMVNVKISSLRHADTSDKVFYLPKEALERIVKIAEVKLDKFVVEDKTVLDKDTFTKSSNAVFENNIVVVTKQSPENILDFSENLIDFEEFNKISLTNNIVDKEKLLPIITDSENKIYPDLPIEKK